MIAIGSFAAGACRREDEPSARQRPPLRIAIDLWGGYYPLLIAEKQGRFRDRELGVVVEIPENTDHILASFAARSYDAIAVALGDIVNVAQRNPDVRVVMVSDHSNGGDALIGAKPFTGPESLRGARIGTNLGGFGEILIRAFAERNQVSFDELTLVDVDAADVPEMLAKGAFDVGHTWEPYVTRMIESGCSAWFDSSAVRGLIPSCVAFQKKIIDTRREDVAAFLEIWQDAQVWWREHFDEGLSLAAMYPQVRAGALPFLGVSLVDRAENRRIFGNSDGADDVFRIARHYVEHFTARGLLTHSPQPEELIDPSFAREW